MTTTGKVMLGDQGGCRHDDPPVRRFHGGLNTRRNPVVVVVPRLGVVLPWEGP